ncbi:hypothetical protein BDZ97DRAFT_1841362 [Flammula alnicola]|nr:hypothetical protein BDZ97DRAFT_1841362 [Flammula alnicola]
MQDRIGRGSLDLFDILSTPKYKSGGLLERRGYQITDGEIILSPSKVNGAVSEKKSVPSLPVRQEFGMARSVISSFRPANSFALVVTVKEPASSCQLPFRRTSTLAAALGKAGPSTTSLKGETSSKSGSASAPSPQIFAGKRLRALAEAKSPAVRNAIEQLGGSRDDVDECSPHRHEPRRGSACALACCEDQEVQIYIRNYNP